MGILSAKTATLLLSCFTGLSTAADLPSDEPCLSACMLATGIQTSFEAVNSTWDSDTTPWQLRIQPDPTGVAFPKTHDEVAASLSCARECTTKVTARCGGHSYGSYGVGQNSGAFVIDMVNFKNMSYDASTELFTYGGGSILSDGASWLWNNHARHFPHVRGNRVGLSGSSIGSGFGSTSRFLGTPMDYLHSVEYMLYNGSIVTASKTENSDLFFVAQGAGSSYGILLSLTTKTWKPVYDQVTNFTLSFGDVDIETGVEALLAIQEYVLSGDCPDELALRWQITTPPWSGAGFYYGDPSTFDAIIAPLMERLPVKANLTSAVGSFWEMEIIATPGLDTQVNTFPPRNFYTQAVVLRTDEPFTYDSAFALYNSTTYSFNRTDMTKFGFMDLWGGVSRDIKDTDTSYAHANNLWLVRWEGRLASGLTEFPADGIDYLRSQMKPFEQHLLDQGQKIHGFVNYRDTALTEEEWSSRLYADNYPRMKQIKAAIDPIAMFNTNDQSIPLP